MMPGDSGACVLKLNKPIVLLEKEKFVLRTAGRTVAVGVVAKILTFSP